MEIGDLNSDLYFKYANNIYIKKKGSTNEYIQFFDSEGNPAIQLKNVIKSSDPSGTNAPDGIYYYNNKLYIKVGGNIIDLSLLGSSLPEGSIIMYQGTSAPEGWSNYGGDTGISGVIYITNGNSTIKPLAVITKDPEPINGLKYNGNEQTLATEGTASGGTIHYSLSENGTYSLNIPKGKDISKYYIWYYVKADSEHRDSTKKYIECFIAKKDDVVLTSSMINITGTYTYNSEALTPTYTVKDGSTDLTKGKHFTESLSNNKNAGEATLTISAITNSGYTGSATKNFTINRKSLNSTDISIGTIPDLTYTREEVKPTITVKDGLSKTLTLDTDYTIAYNNNINPSTEAIVIITGKGNYKDEKQGKFTIKTNTATKTNPKGKTGLKYTGLTQDLIEPGSSSNGTFTYSTTLDGTYSSTIPQGTDAKSYTVYWKFEGKPGYSNDSGSISSISIAKANITPTVSITGWTEGGEASSPEIKGNPGNGAVTYLYKVKDAADSTYSSTKPTTAGEYTVKATIAATDNYNGGNATTNFTISKKEEEITKSVNVAANSVYDEGGSSVDTENVKIIIDDLRSDKTNKIVKVLVNVIGEALIQINTGNDLSNIDGNALKGKTLVSDEGWAVLRVCDETFADPYDTGFYDILTSSSTNGHTFKGGDCLNITIRDASNNTAIITENTSSQSVSDKNIVVTIKNNTDDTLLLNGKIKFSGSELDTGDINFNNSSISVNSSSKYTSEKFKIGESYRNKSLNSITIYDSNNNPIVINDLNTTLLMGATYNIIYGEIKVNPGNADTFDTVISKFNRLDPLKNKEIEKNSQSTGNIYNYLEDMYNKAVIEYNDSNSILFKLETYPDIYTNSEYRGNNSEYEGGLALNAMTYWLMAMCLTELLASKNNDSNFDISTATNNQTKFFKLAYDLGNDEDYGKSIPLYGGFTLKGDPNICRLAASAVYAMYRGENDGQHTYSEISGYRDILGGSVIETSNLSELDFTTLNNPIWFKLTGLPENLDHVDCDWDGNKASRTVTKLGYAVNTYDIFPNSPGPRISKTSVLDLDLPQNQGQDSSLFNSNTNNYIIDEHIDDYICDNYNIMDYEKKSLWDNYSPDLKNRLIRAVASMSCSRKSMFCEDIKISEMNEPWVEYDPSEYGNKDTDCGKYIIHRFEKNSNGGLTLSSPFGINSNLYRDWVDKTNNLNNVERYINCITDFADNMRFPTFCPNTGRRRPGDGNEIENTLGRGGKPGNYRNELYNLDISEMVVDTYAQLAKTGFGKENGYSQQAPHSYPSGHSAQTWALALALTSANPKDILTYLKGAYEYSINRTICRCHWNSDIIYGRLFGTITIPIINIVSSIKDGYDDMKSYIENGNVDPVVPTGNPVININVNITNNTSSSVTLDGRFRFVLGNPDHNGTYFGGYQGPYVRTDNIWFSGSESNPDPITMAPSETRTYTNLSWRDADTGCGLGEASPINPNQLPILDEDGNVAYARNILIYTSGRSDVTLCDNLINVVFKNGGTYNLNITQA